MNPRMATIMLDQLVGAYEDALAAGMTPEQIGDNIGRLVHPLVPLKLRDEFARTLQTATSHFGR